MTTILKIHPAIGVSRVGNSPDYILSPETSAGMPVPGSSISGGMPIKPGTETDHITDSDLRDAQGRLKPHAQRFRIFAYAEAPTSYPYEGDVSEILIGSTVDGKTVENITWQVHMANKKANSWIIPESISDNTSEDDNYGIGGMSHYANGETPNVRNGSFGKPDYPVELNSNQWGDGTDPADVDMSDPERLSKLVIDAGPKTISTTNKARVEIDNGACSYIDDTGSVQSVDYPQQWPADNFKTLFTPNDSKLGSMGGLETDEKGRLILIGSPGYAAGWQVGENNPNGSVDTPPSVTPGGDTPFAAPDLDGPFPLWSDIDNDGWMDDAGDGPVTAALHFADGSTRLIDVPAWCICADPSYAPQVRNIVSIWDEVYNSWLRSPDLALDTNIFDPATKTYNPDHVASFEQDVWSMFRAAYLQMFATDLPTFAHSNHLRLNNLTAASNPDDYLAIKQVIRNPNTKPGPQNELGMGKPLMPLALGDTGASFLTVTHTQYFFLEQWHDKKYDGQTESLTAGELLDKNTLTNLLGGRFSPGIDLTFIVRDPYLYNRNWTQPEVGTFRIGAKPLDYANIDAAAPFLSVGYTPNRTEDNPVEPGDLCKFMALPWHTDYNSCATHTPSPNPTRQGQANTTLYWSWPAQRPVSVYTYQDYVNNDNAFYGQQQFSVRGTGTKWVSGNPDPEYENGPSSYGRYQNRMDFVTHWFDIGTVIEGQAIEGFVPDDKTNFKDLFLEVESLLEGPSDASQAWPIETNRN